MRLLTLCLWISETSTIHELALKDIAEVDATGGIYHSRVVCRGHFVFTLTVREYGYTYSVGVALLSVLWLWKASEIGQQKSDTTLLFCSFYENIINNPIWVFGGFLLKCLH